MSLAAITAALADMAAQPPRPVRLDASRDVIAALLVWALPAEETTRYVPLDGLGALTGITVVADDELPVGAWRLMDSAGNVMDEGTIRAAG